MTDSTTPAPLPMASTCACCAPSQSAAVPPVSTKSDSATTAEFGVTGMTCSHCVGAVTEEIGGIEGVSDVRVELVVGGTSTVTVVSDRPIAQGVVAAAVDEAGYVLAPTS